MDLVLQRYRLSERGQPGLACDEHGLALGGVDLARVRRDASGAARCDVRSPSEVGRILRAAYGSLTDAEILRLHRGICRAAAWLEAGDLARGGIEAVMLGLPDLTPDATAKLAEIDFEKGANAAWETEPRIPAGQAGGGQWTTGGGGPASSTPAEVASARSARLGRPTPPPPSSSSDEGRAGVSAQRDPKVVGAADQRLLVPVSTASAVSGPGTLEDFALPESVARLGRAGLLAFAAGLLDQMDQAAGRAQVANAMARFGLDPTRPADVMAAAAYAWAQGNLGFYTDARFSGPELDAASQAVMRCVMVNPGALVAMLERSPSLGEKSFSLIIGAADAGMADYAWESRARPAGVAPELQTTSRAARAAIAEQLKSGRMQAHHLVPAYNWGQRVDISALAVKDDWEVDSPSNLIALPADLASQAEFQAKYGEWLPVHNGSHDLYNKDTARLIQDEEAKYPAQLTPLEARAILDEVARINRARLMSGYYGPWVKIGA